MNCGSLVKLKEFIAHTTLREEPFLDLRKDPPLFVRNEIGLILQTTKKKTGHLQLLILTTSSKYGWVFADDLESI